MSSLNYKIKKAAQGTAPHPAILLLHGYGSNADDLFTFADYLPEQYTIISLEAPLANPYGGKAWYSINFDADQNKWSDLEEAKKSLDKLVYQWDYFLTAYNLNSKDISLMGFSQGAILSWSLLLDHPEKFRRAVCMSGCVNSELLQHPLEAYHNVLAFASHGTQDATVPFAWAASSVKTLQKNNTGVTFNTYPEGHNVSPENFRDLLNWLKITDQD